MKRVHLIISGDVVGVGYRAWVRRRARDFRLTGWVKNREDRTVELVAEGEQDALDTFVAACKKGPDVAWVETVSVSWLPATGDFLDFAVVY
jgi:acylphosphatase